MTQPFDISIEHIVRIVSEDVENVPLFCCKCFQFETVDAFGVKGNSPGSAHTAGDLAALYGSGSATFDQLRKRFG